MNRKKTGNFLPFIFPKNQRRMNRNAGIFLWLVIGIVVIFLIIVGIFLYYIFGSFNNSFIEKSHTEITLQNPSQGKSLEQAVADFDESFVEYLLYSVGASELHNPPFSKDIPKIEFYIDEKSYNAVVEKGVITVFRGEINEEDIVIKTTKEEFVKIVMDKEYIKESFSKGESSLELIASRTRLTTKGYLSVYEELTGESITGSFVRIFFYFSDVSLK